MTLSLPAKDLRGYARRLLTDNLRLKRGENLTIETWSGMLPWANALVLEAYRLQARPMLLYTDEPTFWNAVDELPASSLGRVGSHEWAALRETDAYLFLYGPNDTEREHRLGSEVNSALFGYDSEWFRIIEKSRVRTLTVELGRLNEGSARRYGLDLGAWQEEVLEATFVDPKRMRGEGRRLAATLERGRALRISHPNGTHLELRLKQRPSHVHDGVIDSRDVGRGELFEVLPSGWVATTVDEHFAEGDFISNVASAWGAAGQEIASPIPTQGGRWSFRGGKLTDFAYESGGEEFARAYRRLGPGRERPGAVNIGLNPMIRWLPRLEDQHWGRVTLMIGRNAFEGGATQTPYFHGYLLLDGADLEVDGKYLVRGGKIV